MAIWNDRTLIEYCKPQRTRHPTTQRSSIPRRLTCGWAYRTGCQISVGVCAASR